MIELLVLHLFAAVVLSCVAVGWTVIGYQIIPDKLIPNRKPFNCGFCMSIWVTVAISAVALVVSPSVLVLVATLVNLGFTAFASTVLIASIPEAFYDEDHSPSISDESDFQTDDVLELDLTQEQNPYRPPRSHDPSE